MIDALFDARSTFNRHVRLHLEADVPFLREPSDPFSVPSYRISWLSFTPSSTTGCWWALAQLDVFTGNNDTATAFKRAGALMRALGLDEDRPQDLEVLDWTDPKNPTPSGAWMKYSVAGGWKQVRTTDPTVRQLTLDVELFIPIRNRP